uniref:Uncharacterized protein n=1 Tax=Anguilla anguilla TaxID=7936 RepID=A0A0E9R796_ANGAN
MEKTCLKKTCTRIKHLGVCQPS